MSSKIKIPKINARDFATILGLNPYQTAFELLENKIENKHCFYEINLLNTEINLKKKL